MAATIVQGMAVKGQQKSVSQPMKSQRQENDGLPMNEPGAWNIWCYPAEGHQSDWRAFISSRGWHEGLPHIPERTLLRTATDRVTTWYLGSGVSRKLVGQWPAYWEAGAGLCLAGWWLNDSGACRRLVGLNTGASREPVISDYPIGW